MNSIAYFEIQSAEPEKTAEFYAGVFGWEFSEVPGLPVRYWSIETGGIRGGMLARPAETPPPQYGTNAYTCSIEVADYDRTAENILAGGGRIALAKFAVPGICWQGYFIDPDNNVFGIFEVDETAA